MEGKHAPEEKIKVQRPPPNKKGIIVVTCAEYPDHIKIITVNRGRRTMTVKCPKDKVDYEAAKVNFEYHGVIVPDTPCLRCPKCGEILFSPEQVKHIRERIAALGPEVKFTRKISKAGNRPAIYLPDVVVESMKLRAGDEVSIYMEGKRRLVIEPIEPAEA